MSRWPSPSLLAWTVTVVTGLASCTVQVPEPEDGQFACSDNQHCSDGFFCFNNRCLADGTDTSQLPGLFPGPVPDIREDNTLGCQTGGCADAANECVKHFGGEPSCVQGCPQYNECGQGSACSEVQGYYESGETLLAVCVPCPGGCPANFHCEVMGQNAALFEEIEVDCSPGDVSCRIDGCESLYDECVPLLDGSATCFWGCPSGSECGSQQACVGAQAYPRSGGQTILQVCVPCVGGCPMPNVCVRSGPDQDYAESIAVECRLEDAQCAATGTCPQENDECIERVDLTTLCLPGCPAGNECTPSEACCEAMGHEGTSYHGNLATCIPCVPPCDAPQTCQLVDIIDNKVDNIVVNCK